MAPRSGFDGRVARRLLVGVAVALLCGAVTMPASGLPLMPVPDPGQNRCQFFLLERELEP
jgi:hypothetical protein